jgi:hypothetical protein
VKRILIAFIALALPGVLFAAPGMQGERQFMMPGYLPGIPRVEAGPYLAAEIRQIGSDLGPQKLGDLDMSNLLGLRDRLSVAAQKDDYVRRMGFHSFMLPGLGQLETGHTASGFGFLAADLVTLTGTFVTAYYLLPSDLRLDRLNYFGDSITTINSAWNSHTVTDYLPAMGAMLIGLTIDQTLRHWSAAAARRDAAGNIDAGGVTFTPRVGLGVLGFEIAY